MAIEQDAKEFSAYVVDLMQSLGPVRGQRMFGGFGLFLDDLMFGLIADNTLYLKADDSNRAAFEELGLGPFVYSKQGRDFSLSYYQAPEDSLEDLELMQHWATCAYAAALRAAAKKPQKRTKTGKKVKKTP